MKHLKEHSFKEYRIVHVTIKEEADLVLSTADSIMDYLSLGAFCLSRQITNSENDIVTVFTEDFSKIDSGGSIYLDGRFCKLESNSFLNGGFTPVHEIANYILERKDINNMILGPTLASQLSAHLANFPWDAYLANTLPKKWDMNDTITAQKLCWTLIEDHFHHVYPFN